MSGSQHENYSGMHSELKGGKISHSKQHDHKISSNRQKETRMSTDLKMRIITKKKVSVPPSATSQ